MVVQFLDSDSSDAAFIERQTLRVTNIFGRNVSEQERMKVREVIPHIGPIPIVIPLKLFLEGIDFLADNVTSRVS